jgi:hypothetical protein
MINLVALVPLLKSCYPALLLVASAFRHGVKKNGSETWKSQSATYHVSKASSAIAQWIGDPSRHSLLADAGLRLLFAISIVATSTVYEPKVKEVETKPAE